MVYRGQIYLLDLEKERPVLIVQSDILNQKLDRTLVIPFYTNMDRVSHQNNEFLSKKETGLNHDSFVSGNEIIIVKINKFSEKEPIGKLDDEPMSRIEDCLQFSLGIFTHRMNKKY